MKLFVFLALVAVAAAAPQREQRQAGIIGKIAQLLKFDSENDGLGSYRYSYELDDGRKQEEQGVLQNAGAENESIAVKGSYAWVGPDGVTYTVNYVADDNGYQPTIEQGPGGAVPGAVVASLLG